MPTPSIFPYFLKAQSGGGGGDPIQTFTSEPISLDLVTANMLSGQLRDSVMGLQLEETPYALKIEDSVVVAISGGVLDIDNASIILEIDS